MDTESVVVVLKQDQIKFATSSQQSMQNMESSIEDNRSLAGQAVVAAATPAQNKKRRGQRFARVQEDTRLSHQQIKEQPNA